MKRSRKLSTTFVRLGCALILLGGMMVLSGARVQAATTFTVTVATDAPDGTPGDGNCYNGVVEGCTLRAAIREAFTWGSISSPVTILFSSSLSGSILSLNLGTIDWAGDYITVDGGTNNITISGAGLSAGQSIFQISGSHNLLENLSISGSKGDGVRMGDFSGVGAGNYNDLNNLYIYGSTNSGVYIYGGSPGGYSNRVFNSHIGANKTSNVCAASVNNGQNGIYISGGADQTLITNTYVVCSGHDGIYIFGPGSDNTTVANSYIGTTGNNYVIGNAESGIVDGHNTNTTISNNLISGNGMAGIFLVGTSGAKIYGNKIGTNSTGSAALPNDGYGIYISASATDTAVGSPTDVSKRNIISGNGSVGVMLDLGAYNNVLDGNYIGLSANGLAAIPNGNIGVAFYGAGSNTLSTYGDGVVPQFISGNPWQGVMIDNSDGVVINPRTFIGVGANFTSPVGNQLGGVQLQNGATNAIIDPGVVMYNGGAGIAVVDDTSIRNWLLPQRVGSNSGLPIDLGNDGHTVNGVHTPPGPNRWQPYPTLNMLGATGFSGISCPGCFVFFYRADGDPTAAQGGGSLLDSVLANATTGDFDYTFPFGVAAVTMVACDANSNCSEMSPRVDNPIKFVFLPLVMR